MSLLELYCHVDDFCQEWAKQQPKVLTSRSGPRVRQPGLSESEIMTIVIHFHQSGYRHFKAYYTDHVPTHLRGGISTIGELQPLCDTDAAGGATVMGLRTGVLRQLQRDFVCGLHRFAGVAARGHCSLGWFYGFKLHLVINDCGDVLAFTLTAGNVDDRKPLPHLVQRLFGKLFGDKGYLSQPLFEALLEHGLQLITGIRANMKNHLMRMSDKLLLRKRYIIETINDQLKNQSQIEHSRHRSPVNFVLNVIAGLIAYMWQPRKPAIRWSPREARSLALLV